MKKQKLNSIEKALDILMAFTPVNQEMGTTEISIRLHLHKATTSRILLMLAQKGVLRQVPETKKFCLGSWAIDIGRTVIDSLAADMAVIARPVIDALRDDLGETVVLEQMMGDTTVMMHLAEGTRRVRLAVGVGDRLPIHAAAGAKAILAYSDPEAARKIIQSGTQFKAFTANTITDPELLIRHLRQIRLSGYATDTEGIDDGMSAIGIPIFNHENLPVAAVVVVGLAEMINREKEMFIRKAKEAARRISLSLMQN